jgi:hypothetical protein
MTYYSPSSSSSSGLQLLVAATMILTPKPTSKSIPYEYTKSFPKQSIRQVPNAPKKVRFAKSCTAAAPNISTLTFDVGGGDKPSWRQVPNAPKKVRFAKSCTAAAPNISTLTFDVGGGDKPSWLRLNHRANPKHKASYDKVRKPRSAKLKSSTSFCHSTSIPCSRRL